MILGEHDLSFGDAVSFRGLGQQYGAPVAFHTTRVGAYRRDGTPVPGVTWISSSYGKQVDKRVTGDDGTATLILDKSFIGRTPTLIAAIGAPSGFEIIGNSSIPNVMDEILSFDTSTSDTASDVAMKLDRKARNTLPVRYKVVADVPEAAAVAAEARAAAAQQEAERLKAEAASAKTDAERSVKEAAAREAAVKAKAEYDRANIMRAAVEAGQPPWGLILGGLALAGVGVGTYFFLTKKSKTAGGA